MRILPWWLYPAIIAVLLGVIWYTSSTLGNAETTIKKQKTKLSERDTEIEKMQKDYTQKQKEFSEAAREKEKRLQDSTDQDLKAKNEQIQSLDARLSSAIERLRLEQRKSRKAITIAAPGVPPVASHCDGATGAELYREDGEFLARESARAERLRIELQSCYQRYEDARKSLETTTVK